MNFSAIADRLQLAASIGIIIGLIYVYFTASQIFKTQHFLQQTGGLSMYPESTLFDDTSAALSGPVARRWVSMNEDRSDSEMSKIMRKAIHETPPEARLEYLDSLRPPAEE